MPSACRPPRPELGCGPAVRWRDGRQLRTGAAGQGNPCVLVRDLIGDVPGEGGLATFPDNAWLISPAIPHQPHFIGQPDGVSAAWGCALNMGRPGDFVDKPVHACTGREIMMELPGHLHIRSEAAGILDACTCIPA